MSASGDSVLQNQISCPPKCLAPPTRQCLRFFLLSRSWGADRVISDLGILVLFHSLNVPQMGRTYATRAQFPSA